MTAKEILKELHKDGWIETGYISNTQPNQVRPQSLNTLVTSQKEL